MQSLMFSAFYTKAVPKQNLPSETNNESCTQKAQNAADRHLTVVLTRDKQLVIGPNSARTNPINK